MTKTKGFLLTAGIVLAMVFTLSCSGDDGDKDDGGGGSVTIGGQKYKTVKIGEQTWMAENLNYAGEDTDNPVGSCYSGDPENCKKYGRLYSRTTALTICPDGWHLPTKAEWEVMTAYIGGASTEGKKLKAKSGWNDHDGKSGNGTDDYGFSALPGGDGGDRDSGGNSGRSGYWWVVSEYSIGRCMRFNNDGAYWEEDGTSRSYSRSVRCLQD